MPQHRPEEKAPSRAELLQRAAKMVPVLRERAPQADQLRRLPEETLRDFHQNGLLRIMQPRRFGGFEQDFWLMVEMDAMLARGCASTAWNFSNLAIHHWMLAMWPGKAQFQLWDADPDVLICSSLAFPAGKAEPVDGGYRLRGRWPFSSSVDNCSWAMLAAMVNGEEGQPRERRVFLVPVSDYQVIDNWHVMGLRGTGSKDVEVKEAFVPDYMTATPEDWRGEGTAGADINPGPLYRLPLVAVFAYCLNGIPLGIAQAALEDYLAANRARAGTYTGARVAEFQTVQVKVAEAAMLIDSAYLIMKHDCEEAMEIAAAGQVADMVTKVRYRRNGAYVVSLLTRAVDLLVTLSGGAAIFEKNPIERAFRDIHAAASHISLTWEPAATTYGRFLLGLPTDNPTL